MRRFSLIRQVELAQMHVKLFATPRFIAYQKYHVHKFPGKKTGVGGPFLLSLISDSQKLLNKYDAVYSVQCFLKCFSSNFYSFIPALDPLFFIITLER